MNAIANSHREAIWVERHPRTFNAQSPEQSYLYLPHSKRFDVGTKSAAAHGKCLLTACSDDGDTPGRPMAGRSLQRAALGRGRRRLAIPL
jgi:hypothetical protein